MSSTSTGFSTPASITDSEFNTMSDTQATATDAIGLLDPKLSEQRRRMFELINRLRNTGYVLCS